MAGVKGRSGRRPLSPEEHRRKGTFQPCRHGGFEAPDPPAGDPVPPGPLDALALEEWQRMIGRLRDSKTISKVDDAALYQYAKLWSSTEAITRDDEDTRKLLRTLQRVAIKKLEGDALVKAIESIEKMKRTLQRSATLLRLQRMAIRVWLSEFGMTSASRARVKVPTGAGDKKPSKLLAFMGGKAAHA